MRCARARLGCRSALAKRLFDRETVSLLFVFFFQAAKLCKRIMFSTLLVWEKLTPILSALLDFSETIPNEAVTASQERVRSAKVIVDTLFPKVSISADTTYYYYYYHHH